MYDLKMEFYHFVIITHFDSSEVLLSETITIVNNTPDKIDNATERIRFKTIFEKNSGFKTVN